MPDDETLCPMRYANILRFLRGQRMSANLESVDNPKIVECRYVEADAVPTFHWVQHKGGLSRVHESLLSIIL